MLCELLFHRVVERLFSEMNLCRFIIKFFSRLVNVFFFFCAALLDDKILDYTHCEIKLFFKAFQQCPFSIFEAKQKSCYGESSCFFITGDAFENCSQFTYLATLGNDIVVPRCFFLMTKM